ncbi:uncharacterized protein LOC118749135 [Rhagoletis pomonella]|uniref:uncharacterized protein LOC118749135 n=1 Tax=Rhagoletis pomonella TaxID=28610 RepID=UPI0017834EFB|nr:uncharacterized protein LOC118749135 [Rhagoletis pomonella]
MCVRAWIDEVVGLPLCLKTSSAQFDVLVKELEKNPDLARCAPTFGVSKSLVELQWNELTNKLNAHGPPQRTATEWKKIWAHLKSRTKKKIAENASNMPVRNARNARLLTRRLEIPIHLYCLEASASEFSFHPIKKRIWAKEKARS